MLLFPSLSRPGMKSLSWTIEISFSGLKKKTRSRCNMTGYSLQPLASWSRIQDDLTLTSSRLQTPELNLLGRSSCLVQETNHGCTGPPTSHHSTIYLAGRVALGSWKRRIASKHSGLEMQHHLFSCQATRFPSMNAKCLPASTLLR